MQKAIEKIGQLQYLQTFLQFNLIKGFKYIDKAGEIVNVYSEDSPPVFSMNLDGLVIQRPKSGIEQLKVTPHQVWMKLDSPGSLDQPTDTFTQETQRILSILDVHKIKRVGWRSYFAFDLPNVEERKQLFNKLPISTFGDLTELKLDIKDSNITATIFIHQVYKNDEKKTPGVLFDIDVFHEGEATLQEAAKFLKRFRQYLSDKDGFLKLVNSFLCQT